MSNGPFKSGILNELIMAAGVGVAAHLISKQIGGTLGMKTRANFPPDHYIAVKKDSAGDLLCVGMMLGTANATMITDWVQRYIEHECTIYRASQDFCVRFVGEKIPPAELDKLELLVTEVLQEA